VLGLSSCNKFESLDNGSRKGAPDAENSVIDDNSDNINDGDEDEDESSAKKGDDKPQGNITDGDEDEDESSAKKAK